MQFSDAAEQSSMSLSEPHALVVDYTRTMMGFLMFNPQPRHMAMIGLGGGSIAKFCHRHLRHSHLVAVEINPHVLALRDEFQIPRDDHRLEVVWGDGADFVRRASQQYDVLLLDGFDADGVPANLCTESFYQHCRKALRPDGILVANLHSGHPYHEIYVQRIQNVFGDGLLVVDEASASNSTIFAFKAGPPRPDTMPHVRRPASLPPEAWAQLEPSFSHIARSLSSR